MASNPLRESGRPLFFRVADPAAPGLEAPAARRGEAVRLAVRSLSVMQKEALVIAARGGAAWRLASDEGAYLDGQDEAPCPLAFLTTGMVAATMNEIVSLAGQRGIDVSGLTLVQDNYYTMRGSALKGTMTGGARDVELEIRVGRGADRAAAEALGRDAVAASPVSGLLREALPSRFTLVHNGREIAPGRVRAVDAAALPDPAGAFDRALAAEGDWSGLVVRGGLSPKTDEATSYAGSSLAEEQDRVLHLRGICTLRPDGIKAVEVHLYNPHGSVFTLLSEEAPANGGEGRAPDAASYVSAGIGFCFMTQIGRYAKIAKKDLRAYRIVQDTHFSLGGASGAAEPVETHVHLGTGEDDGFARTALEMSEQTCFLHALCRSEPRTRVRVGAPALV